MNKQEIKMLEKVIAGHAWSDKIISKAISFSDSLEVSVCLKALKGGRNSFESRMVLQSFVCRLSAAQ